MKRDVQRKRMLSIAFAIISVVYLFPVFIVLMNSFKSNGSINTETFAIPDENSFMGLQNYIKGMTFGNYPFFKSVFFSFFITVELPWLQFVQQVP